MRRGHKRNAVAPAGAAATAAARAAVTEAEAGGVEGEEAIGEIAAIVVTEATEAIAGRSAQLYGLITLGPGRTLLGVSSQVSGPGWHRSETQSLGAWLGGYRV